jgi:hypothetical protein
MPSPRRTTDADYHFHVYDYANAQPWTLSPAQPNRNHMQFYSMVQDLQGLLQEGRDNNVPNIALTHPGGQITDDDVNRNTIALSFGGPDPLGTTPEIVITGGVHAREWVAPEIAYLIAEYLIRNYSNADDGLDVYQQTIRNVLRQRRIHIIPMLNPAGNAYTVFSRDQGARLWRPNRRPMPATAADWLTALRDPVTQEARPPFRNARTWRNVTSYEAPRYNRGKQAVYDRHDMPNKATVGVDICRNFSTDAYGYCGRSDHGTPGNPSYCGPSIASEIETKNLQDFIAASPNVKTSIDYHSYGMYVLYPSELYNNGAVDANFSNLGRVLKSLINTSEPPWPDLYELGSPLTLLGYDATGGVPDYVGQRKNSRSFVIELDPKDRKQGGEGFELPENQIRSVFEKNIRGALTLIVAAGPLGRWFERWLGISPTISPGESALFDWNVRGRGNQLPLP